jgi:hypothetical protein
MLVPFWFLALVLLAAPCFALLGAGAGVFITHRLMKGQPPFPKLPSRAIAVEEPTRKRGFDVPVVKV